MALTHEVMDFCLQTVVQMALQPDREEVDLLTIARRLGELGELKLMTDLYAHVERMQTCVQMGQETLKTQLNDLSKH